MSEEIKARIVLDKLEPHQHDWLYGQSEEERKRGVYSRICLLCDKIEEVGISYGKGEMTIPKAIELITLHFKEHTVKEDPDFFNACYLGVEALKRLQQQRGDDSRDPFWHLPGETKE